MEIKYPLTVLVSNVITDKKSIEMLYNANEVGTFICGAYNTYDYELLFDGDGQDVDTKDVLIDFVVNGDWVLQPWNLKPVEEVPEERCIDLEHPWD